MKRAAAALLVGVLAWAGLPARAQAGESSEPKRGPMAANAHPGWEVATVRPSDLDAKPGPNQGLLAFRILGRHILIERQTVESMMMVGFGLQKSQIAGGPEWVRTQPFDVDGLADVNGEPNVEQFQSMIRRLLTERFGLQTHREERNMAVYALQIAKNGPKLAESKGDRNGAGRIQVGGGEGYRSLTFRDVSMQDLPVMMVLYLDRPLVDRTGLRGLYEFTLKYTYDEERAPADGTAPPSLFTAVQEQLGLRLNAVRAPAPILVIDQVRRPEAN